MLITDMQERLRRLVRERIEAGETTGTELASRAGFQQAHISNFLNRRRGLSVEGMDRLLKVLQVEAELLLPRPSRGVVERETLFTSVPVVTPGALLQSDFGADEVVEYLRFKKSFLRRIRPEMANHREDWQRWVMMRTDRDSGEAMRPRLLPGAMLLIDRHYNSLRCYRRNEPNLYAVSCGGSFRVRYVELQGSQLTLRPENQRAVLGCVLLEKGKTFADYVVGRVAHIAIET